MNQETLLFKELLKVLAGIRSELREIKNALKGVRDG